MQIPWFALFQLMQKCHCMVMVRHCPRCWYPFSASSFSCHFLQETMPNPTPCNKTKKLKLSVFHSVSNVVHERDDRPPEARNNMHVIRIMSLKTRERQILHPIQQVLCCYVAFSCFSLFAPTKYGIRRQFCFSKNKVQWKSWPTQMPQNFKNLI